MTLMSEVTGKRRRPTVGLGPGTVRGRWFEDHQSPAYFPRPKLYERYIASVQTTLERGKCLVSRSGEEFTVCDLPYRLKTRGAFFISVRLLTSR